jgi:hypothetical protein
MGDLSEDEKRKLDEMIETWDDVHRAIQFLKATGRVVKWLIGLGASIAIIYSCVMGGSPKA